jgi:hypothetical protein
MLRKLAVTGVLTGLVAVVVGGGTLAFASSGDAEHATFRLIEIRTAVYHVDVGPSGLSVGDEYIFASQLRNRENTRSVGAANDVCTVLTPTGALVHCVTTIRLTAGTIELAGVADPTRSFFTLGITGGTDGYDDVRGQLVATPSGGGTEVLSLDIDRR